MKRSTFTPAICLLAVAIGTAQWPKELQDPFLDNFIGNWRVERKMGNRHTSRTSAHGEWVLKHQFIELHYGSADGAPEYEAFVLMGFDDAARDYVCHWIDVFGARYSELGRGKIDSNLLAIEFRFEPKDDDLTNEFTFDPRSKS